MFLVFVESAGLSYSSIPTGYDYKLCKGIKSTLKYIMLIAETGCSHNIGERIIIPAREEIIKTVRKMNPEPVP